MPRVIGTYPDCGAASLLRIRGYEPINRFAASVDAHATSQTRLRPCLFVGEFEEPVFNEVDGGRAAVRFIRLERVHQDERVSVRRDVVVGNEQRAHDQTWVLEQRLRFTRRKVGTGYHRNSDQPVLLDIEKFLAVA